ncbi:MAG: hypothetical protein QNJ51_20160 [Calothrix sp. MO_167.B12]|nr:hypothetical protein [Calothrix sp. MO_167.B12]
MTPTKDELHDQLNIWGYYREQEDVYGQVLDKINPKLNAIILNSLGRLSDDLGDYAQARVKELLWEI